MGNFNRPRLLVIASTYPRWSGDVEPAFVHELSRRLASTFEVTVLCPHAPGASRMEQLDGVEIIRYRYAPERLEVLVNAGGIVTNLRRRFWTILLVPSFVISQAWSVWRLVSDRSPAAIHAHWILPQGLVLAVLRAIGAVRIPFMVTSHGADLYALKGGLFDALKRFCLKRASSITVVSNGMRTAIARLGFDPVDINVEPMGVDMAGLFTEQPAVPRSDFEILFVGRLVEKKGLKHLLDAMSSVLKDCPNASLTIAGSGPELPERQQQCAELGIAHRVSFLGGISQAELPTLYRRARLFVAPFVEAAGGDQEGLGLVTLEALACGCPVVISDLPATRDLGAAVSGLVRVAPGDSEALAGAILAVLNGLQEQVVIDIGRFDWGHRASSYQRLLGKMAGLE